MEGAATTMAESLTTAIAEVVDIFTTNVVPLLTTAPFSYYLGLSLFGCGCAIFAKVRGIV